MEIPRPISEATVREALQQLRPSHPRVIATPERVAALRTTTATAPAAILAQTLQQQAVAILELPPVTYDKEGRRLLMVSREVLRRLTILGIAWFSSGDTRFVRRAETELFAVRDFVDWNPSHYLDVAEMALAVAIAYDWFFDALSAEARAAAESAIQKHAFATALPPDGTYWTRSRNNWGQVCHGGLTAAALAFYEADPATATAILHRAVNNVQIAAISYAPLGVYPEGPMYWEYGTSFQVVLIEALRSALNNDFGLSAMPGFMESAAVVLHETGATGKLYGFADGGSVARYLALLRWFAANRAVALPASAPERDTALMAERRLGRLEALNVFWIDQVPPATAATPPLDLQGEGVQPIVTMRSAWDDPTAWFVGIKGGSPQGPHGHMDGGSFVLEARGVRWVLDLGADNYHKIESRGMGLWDGRQEGDRWRVFRLSTAAHSVTRINDAQQHAAGFAKLHECLINVESPACRLDLTSLYPAATAVERCFDFHNRQALHVTDTFSGLAPGARVTWSFATAAEAIADPADPSALLLRKEGRELHLLNSADNATPWRVVEANTLLQEWDSPLPGINIVAFDATAATDGTLTIAVRFA